MTGRPLSTIPADTHRGTRSRQLSVSLSDEEAAAEDRPMTDPLTHLVETWQTQAESLRSDAEDDAAEHTARMRAVMEEHADALDQCADDLERALAAQPTAVKCQQHGWACPECAPAAESEGKALHGWQPIDTAPKDRTYIAGMVDDHGELREARLCFGDWSRHMTHWIDAPVPAGTRLRGAPRALALAQQQEAQRAVSRISTAAAPDSGGCVEPSSD